MAVLAYTRVSTSQQAEGESLDAQERKLRGWAMMQDRELTHVYVDEGVSGSVSVKDRPAGKALLAAAAKGDVIVAVKLDRMFRSALDALQTTEDLKRRGVTLVLLDLGEVSNGLAKMFLTVAAAFAEAERDRIRERVTDMKRDQRERGRYLGGIVPFGYRVQDGGLVEVAEQQAVVATAKALRQEGKPLRAIQAALIADHATKLSLDAISRIVA